MRRRWIADSFEPATGHPTRASLTGAQAAHLARVLRAEPGQIFDVVANGFLHRAEVVTASPERVDFTLHEELDAEAALPLHLLLAVFKFARFEWAIEKATELGVASVTPVLARCTEKHLAQAAVRRVERWRRIAHEAAQQSRRTDVPLIADAVALKTALEQVDRRQAADATSDVTSARILLSETEQAHSLAEALAASKATGAPVTWLAIGPEGGWTAEEMAQFTAAHWTHVTLGPRILRAETAAIAAIAVAGALLGAPAVADRR